MFSFAVFFHIINGTIFGKTLLDNVSWFFSTAFMGNISLSKKNSARYDKKCVLVFMQRPRYCKILEEREFCGQIFDKTHIKFHENLSNWSLVPCGRTDRHDEANSRFSQFCKRS
jgi:hypothetical protein